MSDEVSSTLLFVLIVAVVLAYIILLILFAKRKNKKLSTRWLWFYSHIRLPLGMLFTIMSFFSSMDVLSSNRSSFISNRQYNNSLTILAIICIGYFLLLLFTWFGLSKRKRWGWYLNWLVLIVEVLSYPFSLLSLQSVAPFQNCGEYLIGVGLGTFWWFLPNAIYFGKRKCLFSKGVN